MQYEQAKLIAREAALELVPFCEPGMVHVAGSLRRKNPTVNDIDLVVVPKSKLVKEDDLFGLPIFHEQRDPGFIHTVNSWPKVKGSANGRYTKRQFHPDITIDLWITTNMNFGYILAIRTGSEEFIRSLAVQWRQIGYRGEDGSLMRSGVNVPIQSELDLFKVLQMPYIEPEKRNRAYNFPKRFEHQRFQR